MTYTEDQAIEALRTFAEREGHPPTFEGWKARRKRPSPQALRRMFGSWSRALEAAGLPTLPRGGNGADVEGTERAIARLELGYSLGHVARELGVTSQALGRRITRYREKRGLPPMEFKRARLTLVELEAAQLRDPLR